MTLIIIDTCHYGELWSYLIKPPGLCRLGALCQVACTHALYGNIPLLSETHPCSAARSSFTANWVHIELEVCDIRSQIAPWKKRQEKNILKKEKKKVWPAKALKKSIRPSCCPHAVSKLKSILCRLADRS